MSVSNQQEIIRKSSNNDKSWNIGKQEFFDNEICAKYAPHPRFLPVCREGARVGLIIEQKS
jgi:hypothetical protein